MLKKTNVSYPVKISNNPLYDLIVFKSHYFPKNYVYLLVDRYSKQAAVIDPSWVYNEIIRYLENENITLKYIFITHHHADHINLVNRLQKKYTVQVFAHKDELPLFPSGMSYVTGLEHNESIYLDYLVITCLHTPGHTIGSACYLTNSHLFSGDTVFTEGCGLCSSEEMAAKMYDSFQYLKNNLTNNIMICPGHSYSERHIEPFSYHLTSNIYFQFDEPQKFINYRLRKNQKNLFRFV